MIEQWQYFENKSSGYSEINLLLAFTNTNYYLGCESTDSNAPIRMFCCGINSRTKNSFKMKAIQTDDGGYNEYTSSFVIFANGY